MKPILLQNQAVLFTQCARNYARYRPGYAVKAVDEVMMRASLAPRDRVCDLGAGTGILSELLARRGLRVAAVEPLQEMRTSARSRLKDSGLPIVFRRGAAEQIPLRDSSVRAVFCGQAFHWFDHPKALREIHRVLHPDGSLAVMWNNRESKRERWIARMEALIQKYNPTYRLDYRTRDWKPVIEEGGKFVVIEHRQFPTVQYVSIPGILGLMSSFSYVQVIPERERRLLMRDVRRMLLDLCGSAPGRAVLMPMRTDLYLAQRIGEAQPACGSINNL